MRLLLDSDLYEYEIRGLYLAFFPGEKFETEGTPDMENTLWIHEGKRSENEQEISISFNYGGKVRERAVTLLLGDKKEAKTVFKRALYRVLSEATKKTLPWGTLTGIRPTKIPMAMLESGKSEIEIRRHMEEELLVSPGKTGLSLNIAKRELKLLDRLDKKEGWSLYIGIPFCPSICLYCSFSSFALDAYKNIVGDYLRALEKELMYVAEAFKGRPLQTIYFGGGTPTTLSPSELSFLLTRITELFDLSDLLEWTVEAGRPDSLTREKLLALQAAPVSRISVNPQTMHQKTLDLIGRKHTVQDVERAYALSRELGFDNINMDLIMGLPGETEADIEETMKRVCALNPDNVTIHSLALKRASRLNLLKDEYRAYRMENSDAVMDMCRNYLSGIGEKPYYLYRQKNMAGNQENVGYAREGKEGIYNILIMEEVQTIVALGAGAVSKRVYEDGRIERCDNVKDVRLYISEIDEMVGRKKDLFS